MAIELNITPTKRFSGMVRWIVQFSFVILFGVAVAGPVSGESIIDTVAALQERSVGDSAAPVTVIEYASMTCHHCADFHNNTFETFKQRYIDTGKVRLIYRDFPLDGIALRAATMARCIDGEQYFELVQRIYKDQNNWTHTRDPIAELAAIGWMSGLDQVMLKACLTSENLVDGVLNIRQQGAAKGVVSTPSFVINDVVYPGNRSIEELSAIIDPLLESK